MTLKEFNKKKKKLLKKALKVDKKIEKMNNKFNKINDKLQQLYTDFPTDLKSGYCLNTKENIKILEDQGFVYSRDQKTTDTKYIKIYNNFNTRYYYFIRGDSWGNGLYYENVNGKLVN